MRAKSQFLFAGLFVALLQQPVTAQWTTQTEPAQTKPVQAEPAQAAPVQAEPVQAEPAQAAPAKTEPAKTQPAKTEPAQTESAQTEPAFVTDIKTLEAQVLGTAPEKESVEQRLIAMEKKLFGKELTGGLLDRLTRIREAQNTATLAAASRVPPISPPATSTPAKLSLSADRAAKLNAAHKLFDAKNYKGARELIESFIAQNPLVYNGWYLLGLIDLKMHDALPEYDQFAYNQFLKARYLAPRSPDCTAICAYVMNVVMSVTRSDPRSVITSSFNADSPQTLLNIGVNCFLRADDANAKDMFDFVMKYCPAGAASAFYNTGAMAEKRGQLAVALKMYQSALDSCNDRDSLVAGKYIGRLEVDRLSARLIRRTIQRLELKIKDHDKAWTGIDQDKGARLTSRCTINRLTSDYMGDIHDAGESTDQ